MTKSNERLEEISISHALEYYKNHCEFLGYFVEEEDEFRIHCHHARRDELLLTLLRQSAGLMAQIYYVFPERFKNDLIPLYMYANELNNIFIFIKACIRTVEDKPPYIVLSSVLEGEYTKQSFAVFLDNIDYDMQQFHSYPKTRDLWRTSDETPF